MKYYISGPITGNAEYRKQFDEAEEALRAAGFDDLINPAKLDDVGRLDPKDDYEAIMDIDLILLSRCQGLVQLTGWEGSRGANREYGYAIARGMEVVDIREVHPLVTMEEALEKPKKRGRKREAIDHELVHNLRQQGYSWRKICTELGKKEDYSTVLRNYHLDLYPEDAEVTVREPVDVGKIKALWKAKWSIAKIADEMRMSEETVKEVLRC